MNKEVSENMEYPAIKKLRLIPLSSLIPKQYEENSYNWLYGEFFDHNVYAYKLFTLEKEDYFIDMSNKIFNDLTHIKEIKNKILSYSVDSEEPFRFVSTAFSLSCAPNEFYITKNDFIKFFSFYPTIEKFYNELKQTSKYKEYIYIKFCHVVEIQEEIVKNEIAEENEPTVDKIKLNLLLNIKALFNDRSPYCIYIIDD